MLLVPLTCEANGSGWYRPGIVSYRWLLCYGVSGSRSAWSDVGADIHRSADQAWSGRVSAVIVRRGLRLFRNCSQPEP